jgi:hypothetical protein
VEFEARIGESTVGGDGGCLREMDVVNCRRVVLGSRSSRTTRPQQKGSATGMSNVQDNNVPAYAQGRQAVDNSTVQAMNSVMAVNAPMNGAVKNHQRKSPASMVQVWQVDTCGSGAAEMKHCISKVKLDIANQMGGAVVAVNSAVCWCCEEWSKEKRCVCVEDLLFQFFQLGGIAIGEYKQHGALRYSSSSEWTLRIRPNITLRSIDQIRVDNDNHRCCDTARRQTEQDVQKSGTQN